MANKIDKFVKYTTLLDEKMVQETVTNDLTGASEVMVQGANAEEIVIQKIDVDGLGNYDRAKGYTHGDVSLTNETVKCNFDRSRMFGVDAVDNMDTAGMAFGKVAGTFIKRKVGPELDAFRFSKYANKPGVHVASEKIASGEEGLKALRRGTSALDNSAAPVDGRILYITYDLHGLIDDVDTTKSRRVMGRFEKVVDVTPDRFYSLIEQLDGKSEGQEAGGYRPSKALTKNVGSANGETTEFSMGLEVNPDHIDAVTVNGKAVTNYSYNAVKGIVTFDKAPASGAVVVTYNAAYALNFMIVQKDAVIQYQKHVAPKVVTPEMNNDADQWKFGYRNVGIAEVYEEKAASIYVSKDTEVIDVK